MAHRKRKFDIMFRNRFNFTQTIMYYENGYSGVKLSLILTANIETWLSEMLGNCDSRI